MSAGEISERYGNGGGAEIGSSNITAGSTLTLTSTSYTATDDGTFTTTGSATPMPNSGTGADGALDLASGCSGTGMTWSSPTCTINTNTKSTFNFTTINIPSGTTLTATGNNYLTLYATGAVTVSGNISLSGGDGVAGRYGGTVGTSGAGATTTIVTTVHGADSYTSGGSVGQVGGSGSNCSDCNGGGGGGAGGSLVIKSNSITINSGGYIKSNGGTGGQGNVLNYSGGGSGGSGGRIVLISNSIINSGSIEAKGGTGGNGVGGSGVSSSSGGGFGGAGGASGGVYSNSGGGGGGGGRIIINTASFSGTTPSITGGNGGSGSISGSGSNGSAGVYSTTTVGFIAGLFSNAAISGSGTGASVGLAVATPEGAKTDYATGLSPISAVFDNITNSIWVTNSVANTVSKVDIATGSKTDYPVGFSPGEIAFDYETNSVWVGSATNNSNILKQVYTGGGGTTAGTIAYSTTVGSNPVSIAFDPETHSVWQGDYTGISLIKVNTGAGGTTRGNTTTYGMTAILNDRPQNGIAFDPETHSIWWGARNKNIAKIYTGGGGTTAGTGTAYTYGTGTGGCAGGAGCVGSIAFDPVTHSIWVNDDVSDDTVFKISTGGGGTTSGALIGSYSIGTGGTGSYGSVFDSVTNSIWVTKLGSNTVNKVNVNTGTSTSYAVGTTPYGVAFDSVTNSVWVANNTSNTVSKVAIKDLYQPSGTFESATIDLGGKASLGNLDWTGTTKPSLVSSWSMDGSWADDKGVNNGTPQGGATFGTAKYGSNSGSFDGINDYVSVPDFLDPTTGNWSYEMWVKPTTVVAGGLIGQINNDQNWGLYTYTNGSIAIGKAGVNEIVSAAGVITAGNWHYIVVTKSGSTTTIYVNGVSVVSGTTSVWTNTTNPLRIGGHTYSSINYFFNGLIDEVAIYNTALSAEEISKHLKLQVATSDSSSGPWTYYGPNGATDTYFTSTGAAIPSALSGFRYFRYKAYIATADTAYAPTLNSVALNYTQYSASGALISSKYDAIGDDSLITALSWSASNTSATETIKFQIRSASSSEGLDSSPWCGYSESSTSTCSGNNYFTSSDNGSALSSTHPLRNGVNDRWLQYKVILESAQGATPTLSSVSIQYVVNAPPAFDSSFGTNGISVNQIATSTDANWGKILAEHRIKDEDTVTGYASTTFAYRLNNADSWTSISTSYINPNIERRDISPAFSSTSTIWNAKSQIGEAYSTTTQIKITLNDLDAANNIGSSTSAAFILDTKNPLVNSFNIDASSATTSFAFSDDSNIQYRVSNNADFSTDGNNKNEWQEVGATSMAFSGSWTFVSLPESSRIYYEVRDTYGNYATSTSDAAPGIGVQNNSALNIKDLSSAGANEWREFISWYPYSATTSAAFGSYQVYRSTDGNNYSLYRTITNSTENFLLDTSVSSSTTYYYKVRFVDSDGDISGFSAVASDLIDGQGGSDFVAPVISNASSTEVQSTWAKITWTTDELSDSTVEYGTGGSYNSSSTDPTWIDANATHTIILTGLNPSTTYNFRIKSKDILNNEGVATGYSFTTLGGAAISGVSCSDTTDNSITVVWNTDADASSYVDYSTSATFSSYNSTSPTSLIGEAGSIFQQKVEITGLSSGTKYYIKAKSSANNVTSIYPESGVFFCNTTSDSKPPRITQVQEALVSDANAVITWRTDEPATSQVEYGTVASTTTGNYATSTSKDSTLTLSHFVTLSGLSPETNYYYRAKSWDNNGTENSQTAVSDENDFKTNVAGQTTVVIYRGGGGSFTPVQEQPKDTTSPYAMNIEVVDIGAFSANVNFDTDEAAKTIVEYGYAAGEYDKNEASFAQGFQTKHSIKLTNLKMGTDYHFRIQTVDKSGNIGYSIDQTFTTKYFAEVAKDLISFERTYEIQREIEESIESILPSILPPFVENPRVSDITENSATIKWRTNIPAYSIVSYASERDYDTTKLNPYFAEASDMSEKKTNHEINLIGLTSNSTYNIKVKSFSLPKAVGESKNIEFTTLASKVKARIADIKKDALRVVWTTDEPSTSIVEYKNIRTGEINRKIKDVKEIEHDVVIENLAPDTAYEIRAMGYNEKGNIVESGESITARTSKDVKAPTISNIKIDNALIPGRTDKIQTVVSWKTDELATSIVEYEEGSGKTTEELVNKEGTADTYAENHTVIVTKLKPGALYKIRVVSTDEANNKSVSPTRTIITPRQTESIVDVIVKNFEETFQFLKKIQ